MTRSFSHKKSGRRVLPPTHKGTCSVGGTRPHIRIQYRATVSSGDVTRAPRWNTALSHSFCRLRLTCTRPRDLTESCGWLTHILCGNRSTGAPRHIASSPNVTHLPERTFKQHPLGKISRIRQREQPRGGVACVGGATSARIVEQSQERRRGPSPSAITHSLPLHLHLRS